MTQVGSYAWIVRRNPCDSDRLARQSIAELRRIHSS